MILVPMIVLIVPDSDDYGCCSTDCHWYELHRKDEFSSHIHGSCRLFAADLAFKRRCEKCEETTDRIALTKSPVYPVMGVWESED